MLVSFLLACSCAQAPAAGLPASEGRVTDRAGLLAVEEKAALEKLLGDYARGTGHEIAVLTLPGLNGQPLERLAIDVARAWKIGQEGKNDGALLLVAVAERQMRIEVGRGLEGSLTDSVCGRIIRDVIAPRLHEGDNYAGLSAGVKAMIDVVGGKPLPAPARGRRKGVPPGIVVFVIMLLIVLSSARRRIRGGPLRRSFGGPMLFPGLFLGGGTRGGGSSFGGGGGGGFGGFGGGGGFSGGGASGRW